MLQTKEWMIYTSHEFTITFAGKWLTEEMCKNFKSNEAKTSENFSNMENLKAHEVLNLVERLYE